MAKLKRFSQAAADFLHDQAAVLRRHVAHVGPLQADHPDEGKGEPIVFTLRTGEEVHMFWARGEVNFLYRGMYYRELDLPPPSPEEL
jgi:hypothetical protein